MTTNNAVERPKAVDKDDPRYFEIRTFGTKAYKIGEGDAAKYFIEGIASSDTEDRYGDTLDEACQNSMLRQAANLTMWLNHSYKVPEDIAGTCVDPTLQAGTADDGTACVDLHIKLEIDPENPRAMKCWQHVNRGTRLAFSIGGYFTDFDWVDEDDWWNWAVIVHDIELIEISLVGIPANRRSYTKNFGVSLDQLKAAIVKRAEEIATGADAPPRAQLRSLVRKSFGLRAEEASTVKKCAHKKGCSEEAADDSILCVKHRDEVPLVRDADAVNAAAAHAAAAVPTATLSDPVAVDPPAPAAESTEPEVESTIDVDVQAALDKIAQVSTELTGLETQKQTLSAEVAQLEAQKTALTEQKTALEQEIAQLRATPTGRFTRSYPGGSSNGSEPTAAAELYRKSPAELASTAARKMKSGGATDARQSVQTTG